MRHRAVIAAVLVVGLVLGVLSANTTFARRWFEDRADTIRWFVNEVKTLRP
jgi:hypothetical protein